MAYQKLTIPFVYDDRETAQQKRAMSNLYLEDLEDEAIATKHANEEVKKWKRSWDWFRGKQRGDLIPSYRSRYMENRIKRVIMTNSAQMTETKPKADVYSRTGEAGSAKAANVLQRLIEHIWDTQNLRMKIQIAVLDSHIFNRGFFKVIYDPDADQGTGDPVVLRLSPKQVFPIKPREGIQDSRGILLHVPTALDELVRVFGEGAKLIEPEKEYSQYITDKPPKASSRARKIISSLIPGSKKDDTYLAESVIQGAILKEFWLMDQSLNETTDTMVWNLKGMYWEPYDGTNYPDMHYLVPPGARFYPGGRLIQRAGGITLNDQPNPYWDMKIPIISFCNQLLPDEWWGMAEIVDMMPSQEVLNNFIAGGLDYLKQLLNKLYIADDDAMTNEEFNLVLNNSSKPNAIIKVRPGKRFESVSPNIVPLQAVLEVARDQRNQVDYAGGQSPPDYIKQKGGVLAGTAIEKIQMGQQVLVRNKTYLLEGAIQEIGEMLVSRIFQFCDKRKRVELLGTEAGEAWDPNNLKTKWPPDDMPLANDQSWMVFNYNPSDLYPKSIELEDENGDASLTSYYREMYESNTPQQIPEDDLLGRKPFDWKSARWSPIWEPEEKDQNAARTEFRRSRVFDRIRIASLYKYNIIPGSSLQSARLEAIAMAWELFTAKMYDEPALAKELGPFARLYPEVEERKSQRMVQALLMALEGVKNAKTPEEQQIVVAGIAKAIEDMMGAVSPQEQKTRAKISSTVRKKR